MSSVMTRQRLAVVATALLVSLGACGEKGGTASTTTGEPKSRAEELVAKLGCDQQTSANDTFEHSRWPFTESVDCWIDGRPSIRVHAFSPEHMEGTVVSFQQRYGDTGDGSCPQGEAAAQFVVVGDDWAAVTTGESLRDRVVDRLGGDYLEGDNSTPVSYPMVDPCPDSPPISAG